MRKRTIDSVCEYLASRHDVEGVEVSAAELHAALFRWTPPKGSSARVNWISPQGFGRIVGASGLYERTVEGGAVLYRRTALATPVPPIDAPRRPTLTQRLEALEAAVATLRGERGVDGP